MLLVVHTHYRSAQLLFTRWVIFHVFVVINFIKEKIFYGHY